MSGKKIYIFWLVKSGVQLASATSFLAMHCPMTNRPIGRMNRRRVDRRRVLLDPHHVISTAIYNAGRRCIPIGGVRQKPLRGPSKVGNDCRQLAACDAQTFLGEGTVCEGQYTRPLLPRRRKWTLPVNRLRCILIFKRI
uniref:Putative secreted protein n=1 Tax=Ixodes ricinus TaxID=34613 RepID=A0A6B0UTI8_IXORI